MDQITLKAMPREETGKNPSRRLRSQGRVPAVLYGASKEGAISLSLNNKELEKALHGEAAGNALINLDIEGGKPRMVMFKEVERHPLRGSIQHIDFIDVVFGHTITVEVPVHIVGKSVGATQGGIVQHGARQLTVECLPREIPNSIEVDVTPLGIGESIHVSDLKLAEGIKVVDEPGTTLASVVSPTAEAAPTTAEEAEAQLSESFKEKEEGGEE